MWVKLDLQNHSCTKVQKGPGTKLNLLHISRHVLRHNFFHTARGRGNSPKALFQSPIFVKLESFE